jgi:hypothetical protein
MTDDPVDLEEIVGQTVKADDGDDHLTDVQQSSELAGEMVNEADHAHDLLNDLVEKAGEDPSAPFDPTALKQLASLKIVNLKAFEALREKLKSKGCRVTALDDAIDDESCEKGLAKTKQADILVSLAAEADFFHTPDGCSYADIQVNGHRETRSLKSRGFQQWLRHCYYQNTGGAPGSEAFQSAINVLEAKALFEGPEREVYLRVASVEGSTYLDLGDRDWRVVEVSAAGWNVIREPPVRFRRTSGMLPLPEPTRGGSITALRRLLNSKADADFVLAVAWMLAVLRGCGPYPILVLTGEQGSAKSTFARVLKALLDPNTAPIRSLPRNERDFFITATNGHVLAFDNISTLQPWISDIICRLATGGGFAARELYTDQDEVLFNATRPQTLNGIEDFITRPDAADRALMLTLEAIPEERRRPEAELWAELEVELPGILGNLLDAVAMGLKNLPHTFLPSLPRMADFALWITAAEPALWTSGTFWKAYVGNLDDAVETVLEADPVAVAVRSMMVCKTEWTGTAAALLDAITVNATEAVKRTQEWPRSARSLSGKLRRAAPLLRKIGLTVTLDARDTTKKRNRIIHLANSAAPEESEKRSTQPSTPSEPSRSQLGASRSETAAADGAQAPDAENTHDNHQIEATVQSMYAESHERNDVDGPDARVGEDSGAKIPSGWRARL